MAARLTGSLEPVTFLLAVAIFILVAPAGFGVVSVRYTWTLTLTFVIKQEFGLLRSPESIADVYYLYIVWASCGGIRDSSAFRLGYEYLDGF